MGYERKAWPGMKDGIRGITGASMQSQKANHWATTSSSKLAHFHVAGSPYGKTSSPKRRPISAKLATINRLKVDYRKKTNTLNMTLDQLKTVLRARKAEFLRLTKLTQQKFNFTHSAAYDVDMMSVQSGRSGKSGCSSRSGTAHKSKIFLKAKNTSSCWNHIKVTLNF
jgi:hypothetical protein